MTHKTYIWQDSVDSHQYHIGSGRLNRNTNKITYTSWFTIYVDGIHDCFTGFNVDDYDKIGTDPVEVELRFTFPD